MIVGAMDREDTRKSLTSSGAEESLMLELVQKCGLKSRNWFFLCVPAMLGHQLLAKYWMVIGCWNVACAGVMLAQYWLMIGCWSVACVSQGLGKKRSGGWTQDLRWKVQNAFPVIASVVSGVVPGHYLLALRVKSLGSGGLA